MTIASKAVKSVAFSAALMASTSALANWQGTWATPLGEIKLQQNGKHVFGDFSDQSIIEGVVNRRGDLVRGSARNMRDQKIFYFEWVRKGNKFEGKYRKAGEGLPTWDQNSLGLVGGKQQSQTPRLRIYRYDGKLESYYNRTPPKYRTWLRGATFASARGKSVYPKAASNSSGAVATTAAQSSAQSATQSGPDASDHITGVWSVNFTGTPYGPFKNRAQAIGFSVPDRNGVVSGRSLGREDLVFVGRKIVGSRRVRGIWMETGLRNGAATGRWGLMEFRPSGEAGNSAQIFFSIGYREPSNAFSGRYPGQVGMRANSANRRTADAPNNTSVARVRNLWNAQVRKPSPFPAIHGIWPTAEINNAIQAWMNGERASGNFGSDNLVDVCAAKCMGKEPTRLTIRGKKLSANKNGARRVQISGSVRPSAKVRAVNSSANLPPRGQPYIFNRSRDNRITGRDDDAGLMMVNPPKDSELFCKVRDRSTFGQVGYDLPAGLWSDPTGDVSLDYEGSMTEWAQTLAGTQTLSVNNRSDIRLYNSAFGSVPANYGWTYGVKAWWSRLVESTRNSDIAPSTFSKNEICFRNEARFFSAKGRDTSVILRSDVTVR